MIKTTHAVRALAILVIIGLLTLCSCGKNNKSIIPDPFAYVEAPFKAYVKGSLDGIDFFADVYCNAKAEGADGAVIIAEIFSPDSLKGITLTLFADGHTTARLGNTECRAESFGSLSRILSHLIPKENYSNIEANGDSVKCHIPDGSSSIVYVFDVGQILPRIIQGDGFLIEAEERDLK